MSITLDEVRAAVGRLQRKIVRTSDGGFLLPQSSSQSDAVDDLAMVYGAYINGMVITKVSEPFGKVDLGGEIVGTIPRDWLQPWMREGRHLIVDGVPTQIPDSAEIHIGIPSAERL